MSVGDRAGKRALIDLLDEWRGRLRRRRRVLTIGSGLGNARFSNRKTGEA